MSVDEAVATMTGFIYYIHLSAVRETFPDGSPFEDVGINQISRFHSCRSGELRRRWWHIQPDKISVSIAVSPASHYREVMRVVHYELIYCLWNWAHWRRRPNANWFNHLHCNRHRVVIGRWDRFPRHLSGLPPHIHHWVVNPRRRHEARRIHKSTWWRTVIMWPTGAQPAQTCTYD
jgi:hypothetical protein